MIENSNKSKKYKGLLVVNLGTPKSGDVEDVSVYLKQFLMDPFIIDIPKPIRWFLVNCIIVPSRKERSSELYQKIWTPSGSPLMVKSNQLVSKLKTKLRESHEVELGMRYGTPSIEEALLKLKKRGLEEIEIFSLYPHYTQSTIETAYAECKHIVKKLNIDIPCYFHNEYYNEEPYLNACKEGLEESIKSFLPDHLLFSFHSVPKKHEKNRLFHIKNERDITLALEKEPKSYQAQCYSTAYSLIKKTNWTTEKSDVSFQSELSKKSWFGPFTFDVVEDLAKKGIQKLLISCPGFTTDCLENIDEIENRAKEVFLNNGGKELRLVPSLNDSDIWVEGVCSLIKKGSKSIMCY